MVRFWGILCIVGIGLCFTLINIINISSDYAQHLEEIRNTYISNRKQVLWQEVHQVVDQIHRIKEKTESRARKDIKARVYEGYAIAKNLFDTYASTMDEQDVMQMIIAALRPIRFADGKGYFFITRMDGVEILFADKPELEGKNLLKVQDNTGRYVVKEMIEIVSSLGEGFYEYEWTKPGTKGSSHRKISYLMGFEPYNWFIGAGVYTDDVETRIKWDLLSTISNIKFGKEGYIFVHRMNGDALVSNGRIFSGRKKIWEEFSDRRSNAMKVFQQDLVKAASKPEGDYIFYSWIKKTNTKDEFQKLSYVFGVPVFQWLVGAGVYLDDIEKDISTLNRELKREIMNQVVNFFLIDAVILFSFLLLFRRVSKRFGHDFNIFIDFFKASAESDEKIEATQIRFFEFDWMAEHLNRKIKKQKEAEQTLRISRKRLHTILHANPSPVVVYNEDGTPRYINQSFSSLYGWTMEDLGNEEISFIPDDEKEMEKAKLKQVFQSEEKLEYFSRRQTKSGELLNINISAAVYHDPESATKGLVVNHTDMTKQLKLEGQLNQAQKMESVGRLAGGVAHDFNNMLGVILGNIDLIMYRLKSSDGIFRYVEQIQKAALRSADLTRQLLIFARKQTITPKVIDLNATVDGMLEILKRLIGEDIELSWHPDPSVWPIRIDPSQIDQILANLCVNARDAIKDVGKVTIAVTNVIHDQADCVAHPEFKPGEYVQITVSDNGSGMDKQTQQHMFEPFYTTKEQGRGTGLGLATVYGIVKQNEGVIYAYSQKGLGSVFKIMLPRYMNDKESIPPVKEASSADRGNERILLVEDETAILSVIKEMLEGLGYQVFAANSPIEAIDLCRSTPSLDLLMTDVVMPSMNGRELSEIITTYCPDLTTLFMSGYTSDIIINRGIMDEKVNFISKPFTEKELSKKLRQVLDEQ